MSSVAGNDTFAGSNSSEEEKRALRLASARKKLQTFRASRSSEHSETLPPAPASSTSASSSKSPSPHASTSSPTKMMPLTTEASINSQFTFPLTHSRSSSKGKEKELDVEVPVKSTSGHRHRRSDSQAHRRQRSSVALPAGTYFGQGLARPTILGVFDSEPSAEKAVTSASPLLDSPELPTNTRIEPDENHEQVAAKLSAFSFGSKPPTATFPPKRRQQQSLVPSQALFGHDRPPSTSPLGSPTSSKRLSTPSSRPPSLLLTRPSPVPFGSPTATVPARASLTSAPSSPPTPARRRHSHTRSNSISLPNLKLGGARPVSLGISPSPSYPSSPCSPSSAGEGSDSVRSRFSGPISGQRLKFEPSGRGAEAEREREESRRKALEKLTSGSGSNRSPMVEPPVAEISLPDLDDEDSSSVASSNRPLSGAFGSGSGISFYSRPSSLTLPPLTGSTSSTPSTLSASPFSWASPADDRSPVERWSGYSFGLQKEYTKEDVTIPTTGFGMDAPTAMAKRPSLNRQLSALAEVDESEEDEADFADDEVAPGMMRTLSDEPENITSPTYMTSAVEPTPSRLRELRLPSSVSSSTPRQSEGSSDSVHSFSFPRQSNMSPSLGSPTKGYGTIGRGRPKPLTGLGSSTSSTPTAMSTPRSAGLGGRRRAAPGSGSRGSSISYKKDDSSSSSRDMSTGRVGSPTMVSPPSSMSMSSPNFASWGNIPRAVQRPCPRPRQLVGLGIDNSGSGRVLAEVDEGDENNSSPIPESVTRWAASPATEDDIPRPFAGFGPASEDGGRGSAEMSRDSFADEAEWRDVQLEMEMEREALKEDVSLWRARCQSLEDKLEMERKEAAVLRERVRKLGDRLSSVSSVPTERAAVDLHATTTESRLIAEMREQLFNLTASLEAERRAKETALTKLAELQLPASRREPPSMSSRASYDESEEDDLLLTARPDDSGLFPGSIPSPVIGTSASAVPSEPFMATQVDKPEMAVDRNENGGMGDFNLTRMKGWGFPKDPSPIKFGDNGEKAKKRESFFGLSNQLKRTMSADGAEEHNGVDLPPFAIPVSASDSDSLLNSTMTAGYGHGFNSPSPFGGIALPSRAVSDPVHQANAAKLRSTSSSTVDSLAHSSALEAGRSGGMASSAMAFISGYLPLPHRTSLDADTKSLEEEYGPPSKFHSPLHVNGDVHQSTPALAAAPRYISKEDQRTPASSELGKLDFRHACRCCVGPVIEV